MLDEEKLIPFHPTNLTGKRVLVLAPHPDDETIGCGGSLAIHANAGDPVKVVFLTNGARGDTSGKAEKKAYIKIRQEEAMKACRCLGITDLEFWAYEDRALAGSRGVLTRVIDLLEAYKPELVYAPSPLEFHPDHRATAVLLYEAIRTRDMKFEIAFYEVGQPLSVNCLVDITGVLNQKVLAADAYSSQLRERPYKDVCLGLNRFRSLTLSEGVTHAEGFCLWEAGNIRKTGVFSLFFQNLHRLEPAPGEAGSLVYEIGEGLYAENIADSKERFMNKKRAGNTPMVSVIIPTRNRQDMLREALKSVLSQTYQDIEVIVVNDGGVDISEVVDSLSGEGKVVQLRHEENQGVAAARNTALKAARGCYIAYLDDDDVYYPNHLKSLVTLLEEGQYKAAYTDSHEVLQSWITDRYVTIGKRIAYSCDFDRHRLLVSNYIPTMNIAHRLDILEEIGLFDEELECHEDWDLWIRISRKYDFYHIKKVTAAWTKRTDNTSKTHDRQAFLTTLRQIHSKYSHLVTDPKIFEAQKQVEAVLAVEVDATKTAAIIADYQRQHRYGFARDFVKGKRVLDLACGEGYGSFLISKDASSVVGMESDGAKIKQAGSRYTKENLEFIQGSLTEISMEGDKIFDVIICFEKIGRIKEPAMLLREVKRLLKPDGLLIVSTPNREFCNRGSKSKNPACASGLYIDEFKAVLTDNFKNTFLWGQKVYPSSNIFPLSRSSAPTKVIAIEKGENGYVFSSQEKKEAISIFAVASDHPIAECLTGDSYLVDVSETLACHWRTYIAKLEAIIIDKDRHIADIEHQIQQKELQLSEIKKEAADIKHQMQQKELQISEIKKDKDDHLRNLEQLVRVKDQYVRNLEKSINMKDVCIGELEDMGRHNELCVADINQQLQEKDAALNDIYNSRGWRALMVYSRIKERVLPQGSWQRALVRSVVNFLRLPLGFNRKK